MYIKLPACNSLEGESKYANLHIYVPCSAEFAVHDQIDHGLMKSSSVLSQCSFPCVVPLVPRNCTTKGSCLSYMLSTELPTLGSLLFGFYGSGSSSGSPY